MRTNLEKKLHTVTLVTVVKGMFISSTEQVSGYLSTLLISILCYFSPTAVIVQL